MVTNNYCSLSHVLRHVKRNWDACFEDLFFRHGVMNRSDISPDLLQSVLCPEMFKVDNRGHKKIAIWIKSVKKDGNGNTVLNAEGQPSMEIKQRIIRSWSPKKLLVVLRQSIEFREL